MVINVEKCTFKMIIPRDYMLEAYGPLGGNGHVNTCLSVQLHHCNIVNKIKNLHDVAVVKRSIPT